MFTGMIEELGRVEAMKNGDLRIAAKTVLKGTKLGDSISVNGACLTVTRLTKDGFSVHVVPETFRRTDLGALKPGSPVNLERALAAGQRMGGHMVQGHVDGTGTIAAITKEKNALLIRFTAPGKILRYVVEKGFIAIDGVSLTVVRVDGRGFTVTLIPFTRTHTVLGSKRVGHHANLEIDVMAKYAERLAKRR